MSQPPTHPSSSRPARRGEARRPPKHSPARRIRYAFDNALSRGPSVVIGWLGLLTLAIIVVAAAVTTLLRVTGMTGGDRMWFGEALWQSMLRIVDAGTFAGDTGWMTRLLALVLTLIGIFLAGSLIGLIASAVDQRIEDLRKGRSAVLEHHHTLILGWSERVPSIVRELITANESEKRAAVVVMADVEKAFMEDTLREAISDFKSTRLVCRSGNTSTAADLTRVNLDGARSVIVIGGHDATVVKTVLAVIAARDDAGTDSPPLICEIVDPETAQSLRALFDSRLVIVSSDALMAELTAQACRRRGLSQVFHELLDFDGDEVYFASFPALTGTTYAAAQLSFEQCSLMGMLTEDGKVVLNPPADTVITADDQLIGIASDDSTFRCTGHRPAPRTLGAGTPHREDETQRRMILVGWSRLGPRVVAELDQFLDARTTLEIVVDPDLVDPDEVRSQLVTEHIAIEVSTHRGGPEDVAAHAARRAFHEVIVLGQRGDLSPEDADARTLITLLAFKQAVQRHGLGQVRIVAELLEQRHAPLAMATGADDFIVSDELTSLMIAQLSERAELDQLFRDLFDPEGTTIEIVRARAYGASEATCFADVVAAASAAGHSALGYRREADGVVVVNPTKSDPVTIALEDGIVILR